MRVVAVVLLAVFVAASLAGAAATGIEPIRFTGEAALLATSQSMTVDVR